MGFQFFAISINGFDHLNAFHTFLKRFTGKRSLKENPEESMSFRIRTFSSVTGLLVPTT